MLRFFSLKNLPKRSRTVLLFSLSLLVFYTGYFAFLEHKESEARQTYQQLRQHDPQAYLARVEVRRGFDAYLAEFTKLNHYDQAKSTVPPFLLGRWAVFEEPQRVKENYFPERCTNGLMIEDGKIKSFGDTARQYNVRYKISGDTVIGTTQSGHAIDIKPVAYTSHIHHLVVDVPGRDRPLYAYLCK
jgi:hypothetical protein